MKNLNWIVIGTLLSSFVVAMGAFGAHVLKNKLGEYELSIYNKAVLYHMFHCIGIILTGILLRLQPESRVYISGYLFLGGILLFSGSLYTIAITGIHELGIITPFGGLAFIGGWINLAVSFK